MTAFFVRLEARDPDANRWRSYRIEVAPDLFGTWFVLRSFDRDGAQGRTLRLALSDEADAHRFVLRCPRRRATAPGGIGVPYTTPSGKSSTPVDG